MINYKQKLHNIKAIVLDVDGVLTDGTVHLHPDGSMARTMNVKDGYAIQYAIKKGVIVAVITGGKEEQVKKRLQYLGITDIYLGSHNKIEDYADIKYKYSLKDEEIMYMGDDIPDVEVLQHCGIACCPNDAVPEVKAIVDYVSPVKGGKGCVREILEQILKVQGKWHNDGNIRIRSV